MLSDTIFSFFLPLLFPFDMHTPSADCLLFPLCIFIYPPVGIPLLKIFATIFYLCHDSSARDSWDGGLWQEVLASRCCVCLLCFALIFVLALIQGHDETNY